MTDPKDKSSDFTTPHPPAEERLKVQQMRSEELSQAEAEEALKTQARVLESMAEGVTVTDHRGSIIFTNPAFDVMFGYDPGELVGRHSNILNHYPPEENTTVVKDILRQVNTTGVWFGEFHNRRKDGTPFFTAARISALTLKDKKLYISVQDDITERKRAEETLRKREAEILSIFAAAPVGIGVVLDRVITEVNERLCQMTGYAPEELLGKSARLLYPTQKDFDLVGQEKYHQISEHGIGTVETRWQRKDGAIIDVLLSSAPLVAGNLSAGVTFTALDITARRRAEEALKQSERHFRILVESNLIGIMVADEEKIIEANDVFLNMVGYTREDLRANHIRLIGMTPREYLSREAQGLHELRAFGVCTPFEKAFIRRDGSRVPVIFGAALLEEEPLTWVSFLLDITERKEAEEAIREANERLRILIDASPLAILSLDPNGLVTSWNPAAERIFGWRKQEVLGRPLPTVPEEGQDELQDILRRERAGESFHGKEIRRLRRDGTTIEVSLHSAPLLDAKGNIAGFMGVLEDVTQRRRAEEMVRRQAELLDLAHDAILVRDVQGRITYWNQGAAKLYGWSPEEAMGQNAHEFLKTEFPMSLDEIETHFLRRGSWEGELVHTTRAGQRLVINSRWSLKRDEQGRILAILEMGHDVTRGKEAERALRERTERYELVVAGAHAAIWDWDVLNSRVYYSSQWKSLHGFAEDDVSARLEEWSESIHPEDKTRVFAALDEHFQGKTSVFAAEYRILCKDGAVKWIFDRGIAQRDESGRVVRMAGSESDITERKAAEQALSESEARFRKIFENAPTGIAITDWEGRFQQCNPAYCTLLGYTEEELQGVKFASLIHPEDRDTNLAEIRHLQAGELPFFQIENRYVRKDGQSVWVNKFVSVLSDVTGRPPHFLALVTDVTERKRAEEALRQAHDELEFRVQERTKELQQAYDHLLQEIEAHQETSDQLRESEARFAAFMRHLPGAAVMRDLQGRYVFTNDTWERLTGKNQHEWLGKTIDDVWPPEPASHFRELHSRALRTQQPVESIEALEQDDGTHYFLSHWFPIFDREGYPYLTGTIAMDITDRKQAEAALRESEENLRVLSGQLMDAQDIERTRLSRELHDELGQSLLLLKLKLKSINAGLSQAEQDVREECQEALIFLDDVVNEVRRLSRDLSPAPLEELGLTLALKDLFAEFCRHYKVPTPSITVEDLDNCFGTMVQANIYRILQEVLTNIGKHAGATKITVAAKKQDSQVSFTVRDNGRGFKVSEALARKAGGEGIGLAAIQERLRMIGGTIDIWSQEGSGTKITFTVPVKSE